MPLLRADTELKQCEMNDAWCVLTHGGKHWLDVFSPADQADVLNQLKALALTGNATTMAATARSGQPMKLWVSSQSKDGERSVVIAILDSHDDRSVDPRPEPVVTTAIDHISYRAVRSPMGNLEHDLKTALTLVSGWLDTLIHRWDGFSEEERKGTLDTIRTQTDRAVNKAEMLLESVSVESSTLRRSELINLAGVLADAAQLFDGASEAHEVRYSGPAVLEIEADPEAVEQIFNQLLENALKYAPHGGAIDITAEAQDGVITIAVSDEGLGVPADVNVFERGLRAAPSGTIGAGLGLYIVRQLVHGMEGTIWARRNGLRGSTFTVVFPQAPAGAPSVGARHLTLIEPDTGTR
jgi:signal transduction histidine kinase